MATGRTLFDRWARFYADGFDLSGYARQLGELKWEFDVARGASLADVVQNCVGVGAAHISPGTLTAFFDNTASAGLHVVMNGAGVKRTVMIPLGIRAEPALGDPTFCGEFEQGEYKAQVGNGFMLAAIPFGEADAQAAALAYADPWGVLLHPKAAETAVDSAAGVDDRGAQSTAGGYLCYQLFSSNGTVTLKVQDAAASNLDASFADLTGATSGSLDASSAPKSGIVALATNATVRRYLRWQLALGTATSATFALAFIRG